MATTQDFSEHREEFATKGAKHFTDIMEIIKDAANKWLDDILDDFPFEEAWANTTREYRKKIKTDAEMPLSRFYTIMEVACLCAMSRGLEMEFKVKDGKKFREVSVVLAGLKRCKDCCEK